jgi:hypothetical protein
MNPIPIAPQMCAEEFMQKQFLPLGLVVVVTIAVPAAGQRPIIGPEWGISPRPAADLSSFSFAVAPTTPLAILYLENQSVRGELKLTPEQSKQIDVLRADWGGADRRASLEGSGQSANSPDSLNQFRKQLDETLTVAQMKRLAQVILRHREKEHGLPAVVASLASELTLSGEQQRRFDVLRTRRAESVLEYITSGDRAASVSRQVRDANRDFMEEVDKLLSKDQHHRLQELLGTPFAGEIRLSDPVVSAFRGRSVYLDKLYNRYALEPALLAAEAVQKELQMQDDQVRKVKEFYVEWAKKIEETKKTDDPADAIVAWDDFVKIGLRDLLKPAQADRFRAIAMRYRAKLAGAGAACGHPEANELLRISAKQDREFRNGASIESQLTPEQKIQLEKMLGLPFKAEWKFENPLMVKAIEPRQPAPAPREDIRQVPFAAYMVERALRLKLSVEQVARLKEIAEDSPKLRALLHRELSQLPPPTMAGAARTLLPEAVAAEQFRKSIREICIDVLDAKQKSLFGPELRTAAGHFLD